MLIDALDTGRLQGYLSAALTECLENRSDQNYGKCIGL